MSKKKEEVYANEREFESCCQAIILGDFGTIPDGDGTIGDVLNFQGNRTKAKVAVTSSEQPEAAKELKRLKFKKVLTWRSRGSDNMLTMWVKGPARSL